MTDSDAYSIWFAVLVIELERRLGWRGRFDEGANAFDLVREYATACVAAPRASAPVVTREQVAALRWWYYGDFFSGPCVRCADVLALFDARLHA